MKTLFTSAFVASFFCLGSVSVKAEEPCDLPYSMLLITVDKIAAAEPDAEIIRFNGDTAAKIIDAFNANPPESHIVANHVIVIKRPEFVAFAIASDSCVFVIKKITKGGWDAFERAALGVTS